MIRLCYGHAQMLALPASRLQSLRMSNPDLVARVYQLLLIVQHQYLRECANSHLLTFPAYTGLAFFAPIVSTFLPCSGTFSKASPLMYSTSQLNLLDPSSSCLLVCPPLHSVRHRLIQSVYPRKQYPMVRSKPMHKRPASVLPRVAVASQPAIRHPIGGPRVGRH